jgi:hypothetical protein
MTDAVLKVGLVWAGGWLHRWLSMSQLGCVAALIDRRPRQACLTLLWPWQRDKTLVLLPSVVLDRRIGPPLRFNPGARGGAVWTLGPTGWVCGRLRPVGFCDREVREVGAAGPLWTDPVTGGSAASTLGLKEWLGISRIEFGIRRFELAGALVVRQRDWTYHTLSSVVWSKKAMVFWAACSVVVVTVIARLRGAVAAGPLWWINPMTGGGAAWALGLKAWLGICRFELAGALAVRQCRCVCLALHHLRRRGRTHLIGSMVRFELAAGQGQRQGQSSIGRLGLVTLVTLVLLLSL